MMDIVQFTPSPTHPPERGGQHRTSGLISEFVSRGDRVYRISQGGEVSTYADLSARNQIAIEDNYTETRYLNPLYDLTSLPVLFDYSHVLLNWSLDHWPPSDLTDRIDWADVIIVEGPWQVRAVAKRASETPVVYSSHNVEIERFDSIRDSRVGRWFYDEIRQAEAAAIDLADLVVCTSERDRDRYEAEYGLTGRAVVLPNGTSGERFQTPSDTERARAVREQFGLSDDGILAVFMGSSYEPNVEGVKLLLERMESGNGWTDVHLLVIGDVCEEIETGLDNVHLAGFVDDLNAYLSAGDVYLNPIVSGSGTNIKLFDYFAREKPVVSTPFGMRGLDFADDDEVITADIDKFADAIDWVRENPDTASEIAANAETKARREYTWESISSKYREQLIELANRS